MESLIQDLAQAADECERLASDFLEGDIHQLRLKIEHAANEVGRAWSGSWIGYHANVYIQSFEARKPGEHFDSTSGDSSWNETTGNWVIYDPRAVEAAVFKSAKISRTEYDALLSKGTKADRDFVRLRDEALTTIDAILARREDPTLADRRAQIAKQIDHALPEDLVGQWRPSQVMTRDQRAMSEGFVVPMHLSILAKTLATISRGVGFRGLAEHLRYVERYLGKQKTLMKKSKSGGKVFIGHGGSSVWKDLKDFLQDRLKLDWEEFNRESAAGMSTKERLQKMLEDASFAFLVMTAEDDMGDGSKQARANVIHEAGLFQGRLGFEKAIILREEGCNEFSNIVGTTQIQFPKGNIKAVSEDLRRVLEREGLL